MTLTPWYVTWIPEYRELHIQSALDDTDTHVLTMSYRHGRNCPANNVPMGYKDYDPENKKCDSTKCEGLREAMANAKLIVESVNEKTFGGQLLINTTLFEEVGV